MGWRVLRRMRCGSGRRRGEATINSLSVPAGGYLGPAVVDWVKDFTGSYAIGLGILGGGLVLSAFIFVAMRAAGVVKVVPS